MIQIPVTVGATLAGTAHSVGTSSTATSVDLVLRATPDSTVNDVSTPSPYSSNNIYINIDIYSVCQL